jgi:hypothetical protein
MVKCIINYKTVFANLYTNHSNNYVYYISYNIEINIPINTFYYTNQATMTNLMKNDKITLSQIVSFLL